ncbi:enamine deaminase RidA [Burkholderia pseudomallei]|uniref:RidA family protein n=1 Tax=Burkholderia pseudomallei TaxID=28450 RepID=UPI0009765B93|nr:RidA family protein [Burkholderia pseudomallei]ONF08285.1 enamine deaminase RidA [Burkholderia pseudomallei]
MPELIPVDLPEPAQPFSWATHAHGLMFTAHGPVDAAGAIAGGDIAHAGAHLRDVAQVLLYVADARDIPTIDAVYREFFAAPYPNRACVAVRGFAHPDMRIELVAHVALGRAAPAG